MKLARSAASRLRIRSINMPTNLELLRPRVESDPAVTQRGPGKGSPALWMGAEPETLGGQLWGEGTIEPPIYGSPAIQSWFEVPRSRVGCPAVTQRRPWIRFGSWGAPLRHRKGCRGALAPDPARARPGRGAP
jgi:hypothetical protein